MDLKSTKLPWQCPFKSSWLEELEPCERNWFETENSSQILLNFELVTTGAKSPMNQSEFQAITCNLLIAREKNAYNLWLVLVLFFVVWKISAKSLNQSLSVWRQSRNYFGHSLETCPKEIDEFAVYSLSLPWPALPAGWLFEPKWKSTLTKWDSCYIVLSSQNVIPWL